MVAAQWMGAVCILAVFALTASNVMVDTAVSVPARERWWKVGTVALVVACVSAALGVLLLVLYLRGAA